VHNAAWWREKLKRNQERDRAADAALAAAGWCVIRVWEHEAAVDAADRIEEVIAERRGRSGAARAVTEALSKRAGRGRPDDRT
jgi:G:T-mismatch repair DNA endonuclease (very short patch repair protein)